MRLFGATCLLILGALTPSHASEQNAQDINLNNYINPSSPDIPYETAAMHLIQGPLYRDASNAETYEYIASVNGYELDLYIRALEHYMDNAEVSQAHIYGQDASLDHSTEGHRGSGSGSGSGSLPVPEHLPRTPMSPHWDDAEVQAWDDSHLPIYQQTADTLKNRLDCPVCKRKFARAYDRNRHLRIHTGEKPFACEGCGERFPRKDYVTRHQSGSSSCGQEANCPPSNE
ncbi:hypothetical protein H4R33_002199 [Dimargaris cristalligena]|nr:hypothetical protein H4R33_002199 [Dimargaris cristalligena]